MSALTWIDFDDAERQRARRIMDLFKEQDTRDELGLGAIRDSIADSLFPGTSTIQTRLRYMLFVPWLYRRLVAEPDTPDRLASRARSLEIQLADALKSAGESNGIIGRDAGARLQRLPSSVYWSGLGTWGLRLFDGSIDGYLAALGSLAQRRLGDADRAPLWHPGLPPEPPDLLEAASFRLTADEASFLVDRLVSRQPEALLTHLAREPVAADCAFIWQHPHLAGFDARHRRLVDHAELFSAVMHGASLLYNLQLAELRVHDAWIEGYRARMAQWADELDPARVRAWSLEDFWAAIHNPVHRIRPAARAFVTRWREIAVEQASAAVDLEVARSLVRDRERRLKTAQSRFVNRAARDRWGGAAGADRLSFRWPQARTYLKDLADAA